MKRYQVRPPVRPSTPLRYRLGQKVYDTQYGYGVIVKRKCRVLKGAVYLVKLDKPDYVKGRYVRLNEVWLSAVGNV